MMNQMGEQTQLKSTGKYDLLDHLHVLAQHWRWYKERTKSKEPDEELAGHDLGSVSQRIKKVCFSHRSSQKELNWSP